MRALHRRLLLLQLLHDLGMFVRLKIDVLSCLVFLRYGSFVVCEDDQRTPTSGRRVEGISLPAWSLCSLDANFCSSLAAFS